MRISARKGYDETLVLPGFTVSLTERDGRLVLLVEGRMCGHQETLEPHEARQIAGLLRGATECDYLPHRSCDEALEAARRERDRTIDCGQDPALGCAEAPGCLRCFGTLNGEIVAERDRLRRELTQLRDHMRTRVRESASVSSAWALMEIESILEEP